MLAELNPKYEYCVSIAAATEIGIGIFSEWTLVEGLNYQSVMYCPSHSRPCYYISVYWEKIDVYFFLSGVSNCSQWSVS